MQREGKTFKESIQGKGEKSMFRRMRKTYKALPGDQKSLHLVIIMNNPWKELLKNFYYKRTKQDD